MPDYKQMYFRLAGKVADAIELLTEAQLAGEKTFVEAEATIIHLADANTDEDTPPSDKT